MKVLVSSSVKEGVEELVRELVELGFEILATEGTAKYLAEKGVKVTPLSQITGIEESRELKTLHPEIYRMIFSGKIKAVVVIPYQFEKNPSKENIDIGGISLLRAAAKAGVPAAYDFESFIELVEVLKGCIDWKEDNAARVFGFTAEYDRKIAEWFENEAP